MLMGTRSGGRFSHIWKEGAAIGPSLHQGCPSWSLAWAPQTVPAAHRPRPPRAPLSTQSPLEEVHFPGHLWFVSEGTEL